MGIGAREFQRERVCAELCNELLPLLYQHDTEVSHFKDIILVPDFEKYFAIAEHGGLRAFTVRENKVLVGYAIFYVNFHNHYSCSLQAVQDALFILPEHRGEGEEFIKWCDSELKLDGVEVVYHHVKLSHDYSPALLRQGYEQIEKVYARRLK